MSPEAQEGQEAAPPAVQIPPLLPVLPLREGVIYPMSVAPVVVQDERAVRAVEDSMRTHRLLCVVARREGAEEVADPASLYSVGCATAIHQLQRGPDGAVLIRAAGPRAPADRALRADRPVLHRRDGEGSRPPEQRRRDGGDGPAAAHLFHELAEVGARFRSRSSRWPTGSPIRGSWRT